MITVNQLPRSGKCLKINVSENFNAIRPKCSRGIGEPTTPTFGDFEQMFPDAPSAPPTLNAACLDSLLANFEVEFKTE